MADLPGLWSLSPIGGMIGVIIIFYWLMATGRIITQSSHERELTQATNRGDEWKETALDYRAVNTAALAQNGKLIESNRISDHFYKEFFPRSIAETAPPSQAV